MALFRSKGKEKATDPDANEYTYAYSDPLAAVLQVSPNETEEEKLLRIQDQLESQRISREIDDNIQESKRALEKKRKALKILLLGQGESGKSSLLKNFQLAFVPNHFQHERIVWRTIIQLNLIGSIKKILEVLQYEWEPSNGQPDTSTPNTEKYRRIRLGLSPLLSIEATLNRMLYPANRNPTQICVRAGSEWKSILDMAPPPEMAVAKNSRRPVARPGSAGGSDPTYVLAACRDDIIALWEDPTVRKLLSRHKVRLESAPGFFLNDAARICTPKYQPTDSDIVRSRVRTMGIEEHRFVMETGDTGSEWYIYDVGGSRSMRPQWIPYFDDVEAILFLAPLSFNQVLEEDPRVNRLEDSLCLWREICANPLLSRSFIILFLNKMDILEATLASGVSVQHYVPSYGDAPNDVPNVTKYFKEKFRAYHKRLSRKPRPFMCYQTSAIDTRATTVLLSGVREAILRANLQKISVI